MQILSSRQREVLCCYFGLSTTYPMGLDEIALKYDLTRERVRQIKDKALAQLRRKETFHLLQGFLGA
jgi:RNA polymerase primary sigma factor